jgi:hypothetical protein
MRESCAYCTVVLRIRFRIILGSWIRIRIKVKIQEIYRLQMKPWTLLLEAQNGSGWIRKLCGSASYVDPQPWLYNVHVPYRTGFHTVPMSSFIYFTFITVPTH